MWRCGYVYADVRRVEVPGYRLPKIVDSRTGLRPGRLSPAIHYPGLPRPAAGTTIYYPGLRPGQGGTAIHYPRLFLTSSPPRHLAHLTTSLHHRLLPLPTVSSPVSCPPHAYAIEFSDFSQMQIKFVEGLRTYCICVTCQRCLPTVKRVEGFSP